MNNNTSKSPFDILGVSRYSSQKEIRRRYLDLCKKHHPDVVSTCNKAVDFREITVAYELITNSKKNIIVKYNKQINTKTWTRNSYFIGLSFASLLIIYLSSNKTTSTTEKRILIPHKKEDISPWQAAGTTFREWRKK